MDQRLVFFIAGLSCIILISLPLLIILCVKCKQKRHRRPRSQLPVSHSTLPPVDGSPYISTSFDPALRQLSMLELFEATNGFDPKLIIGDGSFGLVYKAKLPSGVTVAVKKLGEDAFQGLREFRAEMETLGRLRHRNIVKILGYCVSGSDRVLIYEFVEKGSLDQWLQDMSSLSFNSWWVPLSWDLRVKIIKGVANGLAFLHGRDVAVVHRDIKASNVLLDNEFEAHIADFGLARRIEGANSHVSTQAAGTMGYMPPEYLGGYPTATVKGDVYSFGVLMFEVATGKRPNLPVREDGREIWMLEWAKKKIGERKHVEVLDISVPRKDLREDEVYEFFKIANLCTNQRQKERPSMCNVVEMLNHISVDSLKV
ncbi:brassinosteroid LRR receptor kinase BRL1-like [Chenopodium quinoa]|uniref:brassinosteroid LRR receptor kinase BRL1-like n=1 Tax=Chenopodium quinoa TaxID=63459 RepID=UPI000B771292|nr:brassinosteroid LRR receptor kinase BRL1-like [Chenopodium quinoa]